MMVLPVLPQTGIQRAVPPRAVEEKDVQFEAYAWRRDIVGQPSIVLGSESSKSLTQGKHELTSYGTRVWASNHYT